MMLSGKTFGFVAIVATLGLVGMLIKNGIVLMDEITLQINAGKEPVDALMESSASRFRPVMLASLTTILGMIPLLGDSRCSARRRSSSWAVCWSEHSSRCSSFPCSTHCSTASG